MKREVWESFPRKFSTFSYWLIEFLPFSIAQLHKLSRKSTYFSIFLAKNVISSTKFPSDFLANAISFQFSFQTPKYPSGRKFPSKWKRWLYYCGMYRTVPYCTALYRIVLHCTVMYWRVPYCTVLYCIVLYCTGGYHAVPYCTLLYWRVPYCTVLYCTVLYF